MNRDETHPVHRRWNEQHGCEYLGALKRELGPGDGPYQIVFVKEVKRGRGAQEAIQIGRLTLPKAARPKDL